MVILLRINKSIKKRLKKVKTYKKNYQNLAKNLTENCCCFFFKPFSWFFLKLPWRK